jgi:hypothetical protein
LVFAGSAVACSCAPATASESLARSDAAIVGHLLGVEPVGPARAEYRYRILRVYRGREAIEQGSTLTVVSPRGSAACALPDGVGRHYGLFLSTDGRRWASGLCGVISPRRLWSAARRPDDSQETGSMASCAS